MNVCHFRPLVPNLFEYMDPFSIDYNFMDPPYPYGRKKRKGKGKEKVRSCPLFLKFPLICYSTVTDQEGPTDHRLETTVLDILTRRGNKWFRISGNILKNYFKMPVKWLLFFSFCCCTISSLK